MEQPTEVVIFTYPMVVGTDGVWVAGPTALRSGQFGWNCLVSRGVASGSILSFDIAWDDGMVGFYTDPSETNNPNPNATKILDSTKQLSLSTIKIQTNVAT